MKLLVATVMSLSLLAWACAHANQDRAVLGSDARPVASSESSQTIKITRSGSQPSRQGQPRISPVPYGIPVTKSPKRRA